MIEVGMGLGLLISIALNIKFYIDLKSNGTAREVDKIIRKFEANRSILIKIEAVDEDRVFLRNPSR